MKNNLTIVDRYEMVRSGSACPSYVVARPKGRISYFRNGQTQRADIFKTIQPTKILNDLDVVILIRSIFYDGYILRKGARGTIVYSYSDGIGFEVEFNQPLQAVITLERSDIERWQGW